jgi:glucokinase
MKEVFVGVDLGGTNIRVKCSDIDGNTIASEYTATVSCQYGDLLEENLVGIIEKAISGVDGAVYTVKAIGMGIPGIYFNGDILMSPNIQNLNAQYLIDHFKKQQIFFYILNDVKCAAMGEKWMGSAKGEENFILVNIGTGISVAMVIDGHVYLGKNSASGEIAYWISEVGSMTGFADGRVPLEEKFSGRWLTENVVNKLRQDHPEGWSDEKINKMTTKDIFKECYNGNVVIKDIVDDSIRYLATALANICILVNPGLVVFTGGITADLDYFLDYLKLYLSKTVPFPPEISKSSLLGEAGILGAIAMAIERTEKQGILFNQ